MNILFLGYWNINDPLSWSTVFPHLRILSSFSWVNKIVFVNIEREVKEVKDLPFFDRKIIYRPYHSVSNRLVFIEKFSDFVNAPTFIARLIKEHQIDSLIARGAPAGGLAWLVWRKTKTPFYIESFEPHADYMVAAGVWKEWDPRTIIELILERKQKKLASGLMPVANTYTIQLEKSGIDKQKIRTVPCMVDNKSFVFSAESRTDIRKKLGIPEKSIAGVYAGRYGGLYLEHEAFKIYKMAFDYFDFDFHLIILTPVVYHHWINQQIKINNLPADRIHLQSVPHHEVPTYLSAADFAFSTYKPSKAMAYLSPVKVAEYWACGLPILIPDGIGDDSQILKETGLGVVMEDLDHPEKYFHQLEALIKANRREEIRQLAIKYRNPDTVKTAYQILLKPNSLAVGKV